MENSLTRSSIHVSLQDRGHSTSVLFNELAGSLLSGQSVTAYLTARTKPIVKIFSSS